MNKLFLVRLLHKATIAARTLGLAIFQYIF